LPSPRNIARRNVQRKSHGDIRAPTAITPPAARRTNSSAIVATSTTTIDFSAVEYRTWIRRKPARTLRKTAPSVQLRLMAVTARDPASASAAGGCTRPEAIGRRHLSGCSRSRSRSMTSLRMYDALDARQNATNAIPALTSSVD
jgi:hypothetical protein